MLLETNKKRNKGAPGNRSAVELWLYDAGHIDEPGRRCQVCQRESSTSPTKQTRALPPGAAPPEKPSPPNPRLPPRRRRPLPSQHDDEAVARRGRMPSQSLRTRCLSTTGRVRLPAPNLHPSKPHPSNFRFAARCRGGGAFGGWAPAGRSHLEPVAQMVARCFGAAACATAEACRPAPAPAEPSPAPLWRLPTGAGAGAGVRPPPPLARGGRPGAPPRPRPACRRAGCGSPPATRPVPIWGSRPAACEPGARRCSACRRPAPASGTARSCLRVPPIAATVCPSNPGRWRSRPGTVPTRHGRRNGRRRRARRQRRAG